MLRMCNVPGRRRRCEGRVRRKQTSAYLCPGPETIAPAAAGAKTCRAEEWSGRDAESGARHQSSFETWLCSLLFQAGCRPARRCLRRRNGSRARSLCHQGERQVWQRTRDFYSDRPHQPCVWIAFTGGRVCKRAGVAPKAVSCAVCAGMVFRHDDLIRFAARAHPQSDRSLAVAQWSQWQSRGLVTNSAWAIPSSNAAHAGLPPLHIITPAHAI